MASPTSHRKFVVKQGSKQIFQVLCLKQLGLKTFFRVDNTGDIWAVRSNKKGHLPWGDAQDRESVLDSLLVVDMRGRGEGVAVSFLLKSNSEQVLDACDFTQWCRCKQGGITCVLLWEMLYSTPFWHWSWGRKSSLRDLAGKDGHSLMGKQ